MNSINIDRALLSAMTLLAYALAHFCFAGAFSDSGAGLLHLAALWLSGGVSVLVLLAIFKQI